MKTLILFMISIFVFSNVASATIINIPDDYETIQEGIDASTDGDTVLVQPNTYVENINFNGHNIVLGSLFLVTGDTAHISQTVIDGDSLDTVVKFWNEENSTATIVGFTIRNGFGEYGGGISCRYSDPLIAHNIVTQNSTDGAGGGIFCWSGSNPIITNNIVSDNSAVVGGGFWTCYSYPTIIRNTIIHNSAIQGGGIAFLDSDTNYHSIASNNIIAHNIGGGVFIRYSDPLMLNNTITENSFGLYLYVADPIVINTIFWANDTSEIYIGDWSEPLIIYCNIQDTLWPGLGNISTDPIFCYPDTLNYHLQDDSPCVRAGYDGTDIGALDVGCYNTGMDEFTILPNSFVTMQTFPNPFNSSTTIEYILPNSSNVTMTVYDVLGQQVDILLEEFQTLGKHRFTWEAKNLSSGVYFVLLKTPEYTKSASVTLLK